MIRCLWCGLFLFLLVGSVAQSNYTRLVNPFVGTGGHGHTYPGAVVPHGMVQLSPDTRLEGWDGCSGYHYSDSFIYGFSHTHLSGTGCSDYGDILLMPMLGTPSPHNTRYGSRFSHAIEKASPGYYQVRLLDDDIDVQLTTTERVGLHQYTFPQSAAARIILDLTHRDEVLASSLKMVNATTITGMRRSKAWASDQYVFFAIRFSQPFRQSGLWRNDSAVAFATPAMGKHLKAWFGFDNTPQHTILVKVALSGVSEEGALKNMEAEMPGWSFEAVQKAAEKKWEAELDKIAISGGTPVQQRTFYTALYHTMVVPNINMDVDGRYRGRDNAIHQAKGFTNYSVFSLWDTYRGAHPLYTLIDQQRTKDYIRSFLVQYEQGGRLPVWELSGCETDCMIGYHSVPVIVDAYLKGIRGFDASLALEAMLKSAQWKHLGLPAYMENRVIEKEDEHEAVSKTLEYAYDDWCIAQFAKAIQQKEIYTHFSRRAQTWKNLFDPGTLFMRPRQNGGWLKPFDPYEVNNNFTEGNSWQYAFYVPQDMANYIRMLGGPSVLAGRLDSLFTTRSAMTGLNLPDITGLIGQYAHGNEPSHHIAYLYNFAGEPYKGAARIRYILDHFYSDEPDGLTGNEDCGQMSAWYVLSALGFYPVTPGTMDYILGTPLFPKATLHFENGKQFTFTANAPAANRFYIQSVSWNGKPHTQSWIRHDALLKGGSMQTTLGSQPSAFGTTELPTTRIEEAPIVINPIIEAAGMSFKDSLVVQLQAATPELSVFFTTDGTPPSIFSQQYLTPLVLRENTTVKAVAIAPDQRQSGVSTARFVKAGHDWDITLQTPCEQQYTGGGHNALIDGITGSAEWRKGRWQGWQHTDMQVLIDLKKIQRVNGVAARFLQDTRSWIVLPKTVEAAFSEDGLHFTAMPSVASALPVTDLTPQVNTIIIPMNGVNARYIRLTARQYGQMPDWHEGRGGATHIFSDEIVVRTAQ